MSRDAFQFCTPFMVKNHFKAFFWILNHEGSAKLKSVAAQNKAIYLKWQSCGHHYRLYRSPTLVVRNVPTMQVRNVTNYQTRNRAACSFPQSCYCLFIVKQLIYFINVQCQMAKNILKAFTWQKPVQTSSTFC